ncbi:MAG: PBP1A family penicillin-binding protein [Myxococcota bacterium]
MTPLKLLHWALRVVAFILLVGGAVGFAVGVGAYARFSEDLPEFRSLDEYRPPLASRIFGADGQVVGEVFRERREVVPYSGIPPRLVQALVASEDARFFEHSGIDYFGIVRAAFANFRAGRVVQGGSTITQQVAKSLLVSQEGYAAGTARKISRKVREAILARRLERRLSKGQILELYLNQVFLGNQAYGVQAAAQNYFRKPVARLNLAEMALLAGLPQAPSRYSPFLHPKEARSRRAYVLRRMVEERYIEEAELVQAEATPIEVFKAPNYSRKVTPFFTEHVRRRIQSRFGERLLEDGLKVYTSVDPERDTDASRAVYEKLRLVDKRQGFRGPLLRLPDPDARDQFLARYVQELEAQEREGTLEMDELYVAVVTAIDRKRDRLLVRVGNQPAILPLAAMRWARAVDPQVRYDAGLLERIPTSFAVGDVLQVRRTSRKALRKDAVARPFLRGLKEDDVLVQLEQEPNLEAALLSQQTETGYVQAMIGGYAFQRSEFNRALQACRQPGSSFKPIVYSAGLALADLNPSSIILDAPLAFNDAAAGNRWKPNNFAGKFLGEVTLRTALKNSMNVPSIRVLDKVGVGEAIRWAQRLGIESELRPELGLALGASCVKMAELVGVYASFAQGGVQAKRRFVTRIEDRDGQVIFDDGAPQDPWAPLGLKLERALRWTDERPTRVMDERVAFIITKMMRNVVEEGTGTAAKRIGVPVAGKTGTTNDSFDAWFSGFTPDLVTSVWVGFDDYVLPMGRYEQGGRAALPIWVAYMKKAIKARDDDFQAPPGVVFVTIDRETGKRAQPGQPGSVLEAFREGNAPLEFAAKEGEAEPDAFFMLDN